MKNKLIRIAVTGFIALCFPMPSLAQSDCLREVFHKYCLGSSIQTVLSRYTPVRTSEKGGTQQYVFADGADQTYLIVSQGRVESVSRNYPGTSQSFDQLNSELRKLYGEPKVSSDGAQGTRYTHVWDRQGWRILLVWPNTGSIRLIYIHNALHAARKGGGGYGYNPKGF